MRNAAINELACLKFLIRAQLADDLAHEESFDIGFVQNNKTISLRSKDDVVDLMSNVQKGEKILLWCNGLKKQGQKLGQKRKRRSLVADDSDNGDSSKRKKDSRDDQVKDLIEEFKKKHGVSTYTSMQYRIWAELVIGGVYGSTTEAPIQSTMFTRAGTSGTHKKKSITEANTNANASPAISSGSTCSPAKLIDNRSKCYKQIAELNSMKQSGLLSDEEYAAERGAVMNVLKRLS